MKKIILCIVFLLLFISEEGLTQIDSTLFSKSTPDNQNVLSNVNVDSIIAVYLDSVLNFNCVKPPKIVEYYDVADKILLSDMFCAGIPLCPILNEVLFYTRTYLVKTSLPFKLDTKSQIVVKECMDLKTVDDCIRLIKNHIGKKDPPKESKYENIDLSWVNLGRDFISISKDISEKGGAEASWKIVNDDEDKHLDINVKLKGLSWLLSLFKPKRFAVKFNPFIEFHNKLQNNTVLSDSRTVGVESGVKYLVLDEYSYLMVDFTVEASKFNNFVKGIKQDHLGLYLSGGVQGNVGYWPWAILRYELYGYKTGDLPNPRHTTEWISGYIYPTIGLEMSDGHNGDNRPVRPTRTLLRFQPKLYLLNRIFVFTGDLQFRWLMNNTPDKKRDFFKSFSLGLNFTGNTLSDFLVSKDIAVVLGYSYEEGANPWVGIEDDITRKIFIGVKY